MKQNKRNLVFKVLLLLFLVGFSHNNCRASRSLFERNIGDNQQKLPNLLLLDMKIVTDTIPKRCNQWEILFDGGNNIGDKWRSVNNDSFPSDVWAIQDSMLFVKDHKWGGDIITREKYTNYILIFDFKLTYGANSGIKYFVNHIKNFHFDTVVWNGPEYQIIDDYNNSDIKHHPNGVGSTAAFYSLYKPEHKNLRPPGEWNRGKIVVMNGHVEHWLNGVRVLSYERGTEDYRKRISLTKFNHYSNYGEAKSGHIMITDHDGDKVFFKNIIIKRMK